MPTILNFNGFRFFFYSNEHLPKHVHVEKAEKIAKFNIDYVEIVSSYGFNASELKEVRKIIEVNRDLFNTKWDEFFSN